MELEPTDILGFSAKYSEKQFYTTCNTATVILSLTAQTFPFSDLRIIVAI